MPNHSRRERAIRRATPVAALAIGVLVLSGCASGSSASSSEPVTGGEITFARLSQEVSSLDPNDETLTSANAYTLDKIFDTLYAIDSDGALQPSLASSYETSEDGLTWTFPLRDDVTFSDGSELTADDVVYSIDRHLKLGGALPLAAPVTDVTAVDNATVEITLSEPYTPLLSELAIFSSSILPKDLGGVPADEFFKNPVGSGPFKVGSWDKASGEFTLVRNDNYWVAGLPYLDTVHLTTVDDDNQLVQQVESGQAQIVDNVPIASVEQLTSNPAVEVDTVGSWNSDIVFFNTTSDLFSDRDVRRAVTQAVDRPALVEATSFGTATPATTYIASTIKYSDQKAKVLDFDVKAAEAELAASTHPDGGTVSLLVEGGSQSRDQQAQIIQSSLAEIGIEVTIDSVDGSTFWTQFPAGDYDFALTTTIADTGDPDNVSSWQVDGNGVTEGFHTFYNNADVNALVDEGRTTPDGDDRADIYKQIQEIVAQDAPSLPLAYVSDIKATSSTVHGLELIPNGTVRLEKVWVQK